MATPLITKTKEAFRAYLAASTSAALTATLAADLGVFTAAVSDVLTFTSAHGRAVNDKIQFTTTGTLPAPLVAGTTYFVKTAPTSTTLTLSATLGGSTLDITTTGTGVHSATARQAYTCLRGVRTGNQPLPAVLVHVASIEPAFEDENSPPWNATIAIVVETKAVRNGADSCADFEDAHDAAAAAVLAALCPSHQTDGIRVFANSENATRPDILDEGFCLHDFGQPIIANHYDPTRPSFVTVLTFQKVMVMPNDGDAA